MTEILTHHAYPPIPMRSQDWEAHREGNEESGPYGWGSTEKDAIADLSEWECSQ